MAARESKILKEMAAEEPDLEMTPMIDVTFLLLIFFIVTLNFRQEEGKLEQRLPKDIGQNAGGKPIDREMVRVRLLVVKAEPKKLKQMVVKRKSYEEIFGKELLKDTKFRIRFVVGNQSVLEMVQKTVITDKQPVTTFEFFAGSSKVKTPDKLYHKLLAAHKQFPKQPVIIDPDRSATYAALIIALNACRRVGFEEIRFSGKISAN